MWRKAIATSLLAVLLLAGEIPTPGALAQAPPDQAEIARELIGAPAYASDGTEIGEVVAISMGADGVVNEIRITTASPLGLGPRTIVLPPDSVIALRGAIIVDLSPGEVDALPSAGPAPS